MNKFSKFISIKEGSFKFSENNFSIKILKLQIQMETDCLSNNKFSENVI